MLIESEKEIFEEVLHGDLDFSSDPWPTISESAKDLVRKMLVRDPRNRITAHEVLCKFKFIYPMEIPVNHKLLSSSSHTTFGMSLDITIFCVARK